MKRRPDIRSAERELAASYSDIGDQMAEYFPKITLLGGFGWTGQSSDSIGDGRCRAVELRPLDQLELPRLRPRPPARQGGRGAA
jgi:multidrug efflux system outer membrane protein